MKSIKEISQITNSIIIGDENFIINNISFLKDAKEGDLVLATEEKYFKKAVDTPCSAILTNKEYVKTDKILLITDNPNDSFMTLLTSLYKPNTYHNSNLNIHPTASVDPSSKIGLNAIIGENSVIGKNTIIHPNVYIGSDCKIGDNCVIYPNTTIYDRTIIHNKVIIHANCSLGADGFGYESCTTGLKKYPHIGYVEIDEEVEIGASTCVDRAKIGKTYIGKCSKVDNLCQIAHNVYIGNYTVICGQTGIAGSSIIRDQCIIGAQVGVADHVEIDNNCIIGSKSGISKYTAPGSVLMGNPSHPVELARRIEAIKGRLPETHKEFKEMRKKLELIEDEIKSIIKKI